MMNTQISLRRCRALAAVWSHAMVLSTPLVLSACHTTVIHDTPHEPSYESAPGGSAETPAREMAEDEATPSAPGTSPEGVETRPAPADEDSQVVEPQGLQTYWLEAVARCTKMGCPKTKPCCNRCMFGGWFIAGHSGVVVEDPEGQPLPRCEPDGCGQCKMRLETRGQLRGKRYTPVQVKQVPVP